MEFLAKLLSGAATETASMPFTAWLVWDEPECPEELI